MSDNTPDSPPESLTSRFLSFLRNCFLTGIVVTAPVGLSLYIVWSMLLWIDKQVDLFVPPSVSLRLTEDPNIPGLGIFVAISFFVVIGALARNYLANAPQSLRLHYGAPARCQNHLWRTQTSS